MTLRAWKTRFSAPRSDTIRTEIARKAKETKQQGLHAQKKKKTRSVTSRVRNYLMSPCPRGQSFNCAFHLSHGERERMRERCVLPVSHTMPQIYASVDLSFFSILTQSVYSALSACPSFTPMTLLSIWSYRIQRETEGNCRSCCLRLVHMAYGLGYLIFSF